MGCLGQIAPLIWWVVPLGGLIFAFAYVLWISRYKSKFENETNRSVGQFQKFQDSFGPGSTRDEDPNKENDRG